MAMNRIIQQVECPICKDPLQIPKALPCQHLFCLGCLQRYAEQRSVIKCPCCNRDYSIPSNGVSGFPTSTVVQGIVEDLNPPNEPILPHSRTSAPAHQTIATRSQTRRELQSNRTGYRRSNVIISQQVQHQTLTNLFQHTIDIRRAIQLSLEDQRRGQRNRVTPSAITHVQSVSNSSTNRNQNRARNTNANVHASSRSVRETLSGLAGSILNEHKSLSYAFIVIFSLVTFSRFVAGATKLSSDCPLERQAALYLFVKGCLASFFWGFLTVWKCKEILRTALENNFVVVYLVLDSLFSICWLYFGTVWIMKNFYSINNLCPEYVRNWNAHFINFGLFLTVVDYIGLIIFMFISGYTLCDSREGNQ